MATSTRQQYRRRSMTMTKKSTVTRKLVLVLLFLTALVPLVLYTDHLASSRSTDGISNPNLLQPKEAEAILMTQEALPLAEHKSRVLSAADDETVLNLAEKKSSDQQTLDANISVEQENRQTAAISHAAGRVRILRDQLVRARVLLSLEATRSNAHFTRELMLRMRDVQRALGAAAAAATQDSHDNLIKAMEQTLAKGKQIQDDSSDPVMIKKLRSMLLSKEECLRAHKKQSAFLTQLAANTLPRGLHCLPLRLMTEYHALEPNQMQQFPNQEKLGDPELHHYAIFSDNILAAAVTVNSTVSNAKNPADHVFHIVTDTLNYAAMRMWFLANPPRKATIQVQNIQEFTWLNSSQLGSQSILNHLRFSLPEIFPKLNKVVLLEDDVVVQKDLTSLWAINLEGKVNGAVETCTHRFDRYLNFSSPMIAKSFDPGACGWAYGMNVFDLTEWRKQKVTEIYHSWQRLNHDGLLWKIKSGALVPPGLITFWNRTFPLNRTWHVLGLGYDVPHVDHAEIEGAAAIHYNGNLKPWLEIGMTKYRGYWSKYLDYEQAFLRDCNIMSLSDI